MKGEEEEEKEIKETTQDSEDKHECSGVLFRFKHGQLMESVVNVYN